jgi:uncharacterized protein YneF (UPF0154 family)
VIVLVAVLALLAGLGVGVWIGMRMMGRNLHTVLAAMTPQELRELGRRTRQARGLPASE